MPFRVGMENAMSVEMIRVGLKAISWDCRRRGGMGIRIREGTKRWRSIVLNSESVGAKVFDGIWVGVDGRSGDQPLSGVEMGTSHIQPCIDTRDMRDTFANSILSVLSDM